MICPLWREPRRGTFRLRRAATMCRPSGVASIASIVATFLPTAAETGDTRADRGTVDAPCTPRGGHGDADAFLFRTLFDGVPRVHGDAVGQPLVGNLDIEIRPTQGRYGLEHRLDVARESDARRIELGDP